MLHFTIAETLKKIILEMEMEFKIKEEENNTYNEIFTDINLASQECFINPYLKEEILNNTSEVKTGVDTESFNDEYGYDTNYVDGQRMQEPYIKTEKKSKTRYPGIIVISDSDSESESPENTKDERKNVNDVPGNQLSACNKNKEHDEMLKYDLSSTPTAALDNQRKYHLKPDNCTQEITDNTEDDTDGNKLTKLVKYPVNQNADEITDLTEEETGNDKMSTLIKYRVYQDKDEIYDMPVNENGKDMIQDEYTDKISKMETTSIQDSASTMCGTNGTMEQKGSKTSKEKSKKENLEDMLYCDLCLRSYPTAIMFLDHSCSKNELDEKETCELPAARSTGKPFEPMQQGKARNSERHEEEILTAEKQKRIHGDKCVMESGQNRLACSICNKKLKNKNTLNEHMKIHLGIKPFKCNKCSRTFRQKGALLAHQTIHLGIKPYKCNICSSSFRLKKGLLAHQTIHLGIKPYKCTKCNRSFRLKGGLLAHQTIHLGIKPYKCNKCYRSFRLKRGLLAHQTIHLGVKPYKCTKCNSSFRLKSLMLKHQQKNGPFKCKYCCCNYTNSTALKKHVRHVCQIQPGKKKANTSLLNRESSNDGSANHYSLSSKHQNLPSTKNVTSKNSIGKSYVKTRKNIIVCSICNQRVRYYSLSQHMNIHRKPFKCNICNRKFSSKYLLLQHQRRKGNFKCMQCCSRFESQIGLTSHVHQIHPSSGKTLTKTTLKKQVSTYKDNRSATDKIPVRSMEKSPTVGPLSMDAKKTKVTRDKTKKFKCRKCSLEFSYWTGLNRHQQHRGSFRCSKCCASFKVHFNLKQHERQIHNIKKELDKAGNQHSFKCEICKDHFGSSKELIIHKNKMHKSEKKLNRPYNCEKCEANFWNKHMLNRHLLVVHSNVSRKKHNVTLLQTAKLKCKICLKHYQTNRGLILHEKTHVGDFGFECKKCGSRFHRRDYLRIHHLRAQRQEPVQCEMCCETYKNTSCLNIHMKNPLSHQKKSLMTKSQKRSNVGVVNAQVYKYTCLSCSDSFDSHDDLLIHKYNKHNREEPRTRPREGLKQITGIKSEVKHEDKSTNELTSFDADSTSNLDETRNDFITRNKVTSSSTSAHGTDLYSVSSVSHSDTNVNENQENTRKEDDSALRARNTADVTVVNCHVCQQNFNCTGPTELAPKICEPCSLLFIDFVKSRRGALP